MHITIQVPDELIGLLLPGREPAQEFVLAVLLDRYRAGRISPGGIGRLLGLGYWETEQLLCERGVPLSYSETDLHDDTEAVREFLK